MWRIRYRTLNDKTIGVLIFSVSTIIRTRRGIVKKPNKCRVKKREKGQVSFWWKIACGLENQCSSKKRLLTPIYAKIMKQCTLWVIQFDCQDSYNISMCAHVRMHAPNHSRTRVYFAHTRFPPTLAHRSDRLTKIPVHALAPGSGTGKHTVAGEEGLDDRGARGGGAGGEPDRTAVAGLRAGPFLPNPGGTTPGS